MSEEQWLGLNINDRVDCVNSRYAKNLRVADIAEDERSLNNWRIKGFPNAKRLCQMVDENGFHTWSADHENWELV